MIHHGDEQVSRRYLLWDVEVSTITDGASVGWQVSMPSRINTGADLGHGYDLEEGLEKLDQVIGMLEAAKRRVLADATELGRMR